MKERFIDQDTPILPWLIAEQLGANQDEVEYLCNRAHRHYNQSKTFRKAIRAGGNNGRDKLIVFMDHWLQAERKRRGE